MLNLGLVGLSLVLDSINSQSRSCVNSVCVAEQPTSVQSGVRTGASQSKTNTFEPIRFGIDLVFMLTFIYLIKNAPSTSADC